jgi:hypothetical protein
MFFWQASQEAEESRLSHRHKFGRRLAPGEDYFAHLSIDVDWHVCFGLYRLFPNGYDGRYLECTRYDKD